MGTLLRALLIAMLALAVPAQAWTATLMAAQGMASPASGCDAAMQDMSHGGPAPHDPMFHGHAMADPAAAHHAARGKGKSFAPGCGASCCLGWFAPPQLAPLAAMRVARVYGHAVFMPPPGVIAAGFERPPKRPA